MGFSNTRIVNLLSLDLDWVVGQIQLDPSVVVYTHCANVLTPQFPGSVVGRMVDGISFLTRWEYDRMAAPFEICGWLIGSCTDRGVRPIQVLYATIPIPASQDLVYWGQITVSKGGLPDQLIEQIALATPMQIHKPDKRT